MGFDNELWDGFEVIQKQATENKAFTEKVAAWFHKRAEIERKYVKKLLSLSKATECDKGTVQGAWSTVLTQTDALAQMHILIADKFGELCENVLTEFLKSSSSERSSLTSTGKSLLKELKAADSKQQSCSDALAAAQKKQEETDAALEREKFNNNVKQVDKLTKQQASCAKATEKAEIANADATSKLEETKTRVWDAEMPLVLSNFEVRMVVEVTYSENRNGRWVILGSGSM